MRIISGNFRGKKIIEPKDKNTRPLKDLTKESVFNIIKHSNTDPDYDLWLLMHSNILVASKSTYSMIAVYFFKGSKVYYPLWGTAVSCGLYTKYDKTNYEYYI